MECTVVGPVARAGARWGRAVARSCSWPWRRGHEWRRTVWFSAGALLVRRARRAPRVRVRPADLAVIAPRPARGRPDRPANHHTHCRPGRDPLPSTTETTRRDMDRSKKAWRGRSSGSRPMSLGCAPGPSTAVGTSPVTCRRDTRHRMRRSRASDRWSVSSGRAR